MQKRLNLADNPTILFQGDSITDSERRRRRNESLGDGYVMLIAAQLTAAHPEYHMKFINRGVIGDRIRDLAYRWKKDCLDLKPNLVSILIGINDIVSKPIWQRGIKRNIKSIANGGNDFLGKSFWEKSTPTESFQSDYTTILKQTQQLKCQIVLLEPFLVYPKGKYPELTEDLNQKIEVIKKLSKKFETTLIPLNDIFMKACTKRPYSYWTYDGVHPTLAGHALIAQSWIKSIIEEL